MLIGSVLDVRASRRTGASAGLTLRMVGGKVIAGGNCPLAALIAAKASVAAPSMSRLRSNCNVIAVVPSALEEVIWMRPGIWPNCSGRAARAPSIPPPRSEELLSRLGAFQWRRLMTALKILSAGLIATVLLTMPVRARDMNERYAAESAYASVVPSGRNIQGHFWTPAPSVSASKQPGGVCDHGDNPGIC